MLDFIGTKINPGDCFLVSQSAGHRFGLCTQADNEYVMYANIYLFVYQGVANIAIYESERNQGKSAYLAKITEAMVPAPIVEYLRAGPV